MVNTYFLKDKEILINAHGNSKNNKIKNDLIWEINNFLINNFELYMVLVCSTPLSNSVFCKQISVLHKKYITFQKLDDMFIKQKVLSDDEINFYRGIMDPSNKISDDVFKEMCCMENVDIEYVASENISRISKIDMTYKSLNHMIRSSFPVYVSLFGSKEMRIVINQSDLIEPIKCIVKNHCIEEL